MNSIIGASPTIVATCVIRVTLVAEHLRIDGILPSFDTIPTIGSGLANGTSRHTQKNQSDQYNPDNRARLRGVHCVLPCVALRCVLRFPLILNSTLRSARVK